MIKVKVLLNDTIEVDGIYDPGSNVSLINSKLLKLNKNEMSMSNNGNANLKTINGVRKTDGLVSIKTKIFNMEKEMYVFVINSENFSYDFLIGLDCIKEFRLSQNEKIEIKQISNSDKIDEVLLNHTENKDKSEPKSKQNNEKQFEKHAIDRNSTNL